MPDQSPIPDSSNATSVVIAGAGACGLTAALAASESGVETLVLERDVTPHGSTGMSYGAICATGTRLAQRFPICLPVVVQHGRFPAREVGGTCPVWVCAQR